MTIISLDRNALKSLIDSDPEFELSLKAAVVSEVARRIFKKDADRIIREANPELFKQALATVQADADFMGQINEALTLATVRRSQDYYRTLTLTGDVKKKIEEYVEAITSSTVTSALNSLHTKINEAVDARRDILLDQEELNKRIDRRLEKFVDAEIDRRVNERLNAKVEAINAALKS